MTRLTFSTARTGIAFRNDGQFLREWLEHHRLVGADKFVLFDNRATSTLRSSASSRACKPRWREHRARSLVLPP